MSEEDMCEPCAKDGMHQLSCACACHPSATNDREYPVLQFQAPSGPRDWRDLAPDEPESLGKFCRHWRTRLREEGRDCVCRGCGQVLTAYEVLRELARRAVELKYHERQWEEFDREVTGHLSKGGAIRVTDAGIEATLPGGKEKLRCTRTGRWHVDGIVSAIRGCAEMLAWRQRRGKIVEPTS